MERNAEASSKTTGTIRLSLGEAVVVGLGEAVVGRPRRGLRDLCRGLELGVRLERRLARGYSPARLPGEHGEELLDELVRQQEAHTDAGLVDMAKRERDSVYPRHPPLDDESLVGVDDLESQAFARNQRRGAAEKDAGARDVGREGRMDLRLAVPPEPDLDSARKPPVNSPFHGVR